MQNTTPWIFAFAGFSAVSDMDSVSRAPILRVILMVQYLQHFQRGSEMVLGKLWVLKCDLVWYSVCIFGGVCSCCMVSSFIRPIMDGGALVGSSWSCGSFLMKGLQMFWSECFNLVRCVMGSIFSDLFLYHHFTKKVSTGCLTFYLASFGCRPLSFFMWEGEDKTKVIK